MKRLSLILRTVLVFSLLITLSDSVFAAKLQQQLAAESAITEILKRFDEDYPSLFEFEKPNLFYIK